MDTPDAPRTALRNADHALVLDFLARPAAPRAVDANPVAIEYAGRLLAADREAGSVQLGFELAPRHCQGNGVVQGGVLAVLLDFGIAFALLTKLAPGASAGTVSLSTQFLRAAGPGRYTVEGRVVRLGRTLAFGEATLRAPDRADPLATATAVMAVQSARG